MALNLKINKYYAWIAVSLFSALCAILFFFSAELKHEKRTARLLESTEATLADCNQLLTLTDQGIGYARKFMETGDSNQYTRYLSADKAFRDLADSLRQIDKSGTAHAAQLDSLTSFFSLRRTLIANVIEVNRNRTDDNANHRLYTPEIESGTARIHRSIATLQDIEHKKLIQEKRVLDRSEDLLIRKVIGLAGLIVLMAIFFLFTLLKKIRLQKLTERVLAYNSALLENVSDAVMSTDKEFRIRTWNKGAEAIFGWSAAEAMGHKTYELLQTDFITATRDEAAAEFRKAGFFKKPVIQTSKSGQKIDILTSTTPLFDEGKNLIGYVTISKDISQLKKEENALIESNHWLEETIRHRTANLMKVNRLYAFVSQVNQMIVRCTGEEQLFKDACNIAIKYGGFKMAWIGKVNKTTGIVEPCMHAGYEKDYLKTIKPISVDPERPEGNGPTGKALRSKSYFVCQDIESDPVVREWRAEQLKRGYRSSIAIPIIKSGEVFGSFTIYAEDKFFFGEDEIKLLNEITANISFTLEMLEHEAIRNQTTEQLKESQALNKAFIETSTEGILLSSPDGSIYAANPAACAMFGRTEEEICQAGRSGLVDTSDKNFQSSLQERAASGRTRSEYWMLRKDGSKFLAEVSSSTFTDTKGKTFASVIINDISERKRKENELMQKEHQLRLFVENSPAALAMLDRDMKYIIASKRWVIDYRLGDADLIGKSHYEIFPEIQENWKAVHRRCMSGAVEKKEEDPFVRKDGTLDWVRWEIHPWYEHTGEIGGIIMFTEVITERKRSEKMIADYQFALDESSLVDITDTSGKIIYANENFCRLSGYMLEELKGRDHRLLKSGYHQPEFYNNLWGTIKKGKVWRGEVLDKSRQGSLFWVDTTIIPFVNHNGDPTQYMSIRSDITERKMAEVKLENSEKNLRQVLASNQDNFYVIDRDFNIILINKTAEHNLEIAWGNPVHLGSNLIDVLPEHSNEPIIESFKRVFKGERLEYELYYPRPGIPDWVSVNYTPVKDDKGNISGAYVVARDITARKQAEAKLTESEEKFRNLVEYSLMGVYIIQDMRFAYFNPRLMELTGYSAEELSGNMSILDIIHKEDIPMVTEKINQRLSGSVKTSHYRLRAIRKDGSILIVELIGTAMQYKGKPAIMGSFIDVTQQIEEESRVGKAVINAQEAERLQIGMELHDNVNQILTATKIYLGMAKDKSKETPQIFSLIEKSKGFVTDAMHELRRLSHQLTPAIATDIALSDSIQILVNDMTSGNQLTRVIVNAEEFEPGTLRDEIQLTLYRILQEQLNNIQKYAEATEVVINLSLSDEYVYLQITDNGKGFDPSTVKHGIGLENIRRRTFLFGGHVNIHSAPGHGCTIDIGIPIHN